MSNKRIAVYLPEEVLAELTRRLPEFQEKWGHRSLNRSDFIHRAVLQILDCGTGSAQVVTQDGHSQCTNSGTGSAQTVPQTGVNSETIDRSIDRSIDQPPPASSAGSAPSPTPQLRPPGSELAGEVRLLKERFSEYEELDEVMRLMVNGSYRTRPTWAKQKRLLTAWAAVADEKGLDFVFKQFDALIHAPRGHVRNPEKYLEMCLSGKEWKKAVQRNFFEQPRAPPGGPGSDLVTSLADEKRFGGDR